MFFGFAHVFTLYALPMERMGASFSYETTDNSRMIEKLFLARFRFRVLTSSLP
jgi:hypothetical protein